jgi:hypothetical protein
MTPFNIDLTSLKSSLRFTQLTSIITISQLSLLNAFSYMITGKKRYNLIFYNTCKCLILRYNTNYNLYAILKEDLLTRYSPYIFKELLYDD